MNILQASLSYPLTLERISFTLEGYIKVPPMSHVKKTKYIFVSGGVISGIGKGIATASIGMILKQRGLKVDFIKCDPYLNLDAGTMNPLEHGEVFVTEDGYEMDMDAGHYERFLDQNIMRGSGITTGQIYMSVIQKERSLQYGGAFVESPTHVVIEIVERIKKHVKQSNPDVILIEIGGTVGEYQNEIYYEAERCLKREMKSDLLHVHLVYLPIPQNIGEMKTKPAQQSVRTLNSLGIFPDILLARAVRSIDGKRLSKLATFCNIPESRVFSAPDVKSIFEIPLSFDDQGIINAILEDFSLEQPKWDRTAWENLVMKIHKDTRKIRIGIIGKYFATGEFNLEDAYASVIESIKHACWANGVQADIYNINADALDADDSELQNLDGILVPGGFGERGVEGKIKAVQFAREKKIPYLGLCYGMQLAVIEFSRNVCGISDASTTEINPQTANPVIHLMPEQEKKLLGQEYGASMRLGAWYCKLKENTIAFDAYKEMTISERHRHRYEFNNDYRSQLIKKGLVISGTTIDDKLVEIIELHKSAHPFFVGVQFHPEFKSRPLHPHPLFVNFIAAAADLKKEDKKTIIAQKKMEKVHAI